MDGSDSIEFREFLDVDTIPIEPNDFFMFYIFPLPLPELIPPARRLLMR